jgi:DNA-binding response OmpR family regulator
LDVIRGMRELPRPVPVIAVTGKRGCLEMLKIARLLGASAVLYKPFSPGELVACVSGALADRPVQSA